MPRELGSQRAAISRYLAARQSGRQLAGTLYLDGKMDKFASFSNEDVVMLIQRYEFYRCLWDNTLINYRNKDLREDAWKAISNEMKIPVGLLKKKMTTLLASNRKERSKIKKSLVTGSGMIFIYLFTY